MRSRIPHWATLWMLTACHPSPSPGTEDAATVFDTGPATDLDEPVDTDGGVPDSKLPDTCDPVWDLACCVAGTVHTGAACAGPGGTFSCPGGGFVCSTTGGANGCAITCAPPDAGGGISDGACSDGFVYIDFPCYWGGISGVPDPRVCIAESMFQQFHTATCAEVGYPTCCDGLACVSKGNLACDVGELCVGGACTLPNCATDTDCTVGDFCMHPRGTCGATNAKDGACTHGIQTGMLAVEFLGPVCGCDGKGYTSFVAAALAATSVASDGPCP